MFVVLEIAGLQYKVVKDEKLFVSHLEGKIGDNISFDKILLKSDELGTTIGTSTINGAFVRAQILDHVKGDKVVVFKKKRRKGYRVKNGHRQIFTQVKILSI